MSELQKIVKIKKGLKSTDNKYKRELGNYFYKNPEFRKQIHKTGFQYQSLSKIVNDYNLNFEKPSYIVLKDKKKWHLQASIGAARYLNEKLKNVNDATGMEFELKNSFYNETKNLKLEFVLGLKYRFYSFSNNKLYHIDESGKIIKNHVFTYYSDSLGKYIEYPQEKFLYKKKTDIIEMPIYFEYNNKVKLISPIIQGGFKPYLFKYKNEIEGNVIYKYDWKLTPGFILGLGVAINYRRFSLKYLFQVDPSLTNSLELNFLIN